MGEKDDFALLFDGLEDELRRLPDRFSRTEFDYMLTSQRTVNRVNEKLIAVAEGTVGRNPHQNFWSDLRVMGLAEPDREELTELGKVAIDFFEEEEDEFRREHFVLAALRQGAFAVASVVREGYSQRISNLERLLEALPDPSADIPLLVADEKKLTFVEFLNTFPDALDRYFELSPEQQAALDTLGEKKLRELFDSENPDEAPYAKAAMRISNVWRGFSRRTNFLRHALLSKIEESADIEAEELEELVDGVFAGLPDGLMEQLLADSSRIQVSEAGGRKRVRRQPRRSPKAMNIENPGDLLREELLVEAGEQLAGIRDPVEAQRAREVLNERTVEHQRMISRLLRNLYSELPRTTWKHHPLSYDLLIDLSQVALLHEAKTVKDGDRADERRQIIKGIGQLLYYEWFDVPSDLDGDDATVLKVMLLERPPVDPNHVDFLRNLGIEVIWFAEDGAIDGHPHSLQVIQDALQDFEG